MWNKGITLSARSLAESSSEAAMLRAEVQMLACVSGTIFGREVVPEVCKMRAVLLASAGPELDAAPLVTPEGAGFRPRFGSQGNDGDAELLSRSKRRRFATRFDDQRLRFEILEVELEVVLAIGGIERRRGRGGRHAEKRRRHFGSVRQHDGDAIAAADSEFVQRPDGAIDQRPQARIAQRRLIACGDGDSLVTPRCDEAS